MLGHAGLASGQGSLALQRGAVSIDQGFRENKRGVLLDLTGTVRYIVFMLRSTQDCFPAAKGGM